MKKRLKLHHLLGTAILIAVHFWGLAKLANMQHAQNARPRNLWQENSLQRNLRCEMRIPAGQRRGYYDSDGLKPFIGGHCTAGTVGDTFYNARNWPAAIRLYEDALNSEMAHNNTLKNCAYSLRLSMCYSHLGAMEAAHNYATKVLQSNCPVDIAYHLAKLHDGRSEEQEALHYYKLACQAPDAPLRLRQELQGVARDRLWVNRFPRDYMQMLAALQWLLDDGRIADETEAQVHWEVVHHARPLLDAGRELFRREGVFGEPGRYYYATPSILPMDSQGRDSTSSDYLILVRLLNYRIDREGRYYRDYLPLGDTTGTLRSSSVMFLGRKDGDPRELTIDDTGFDRTPYRFAGTEDPRLFQDTNGNILVLWTSWEYANHVGEGSRAVLGRLNVSTATVQVERVFRSPLNRFVEKNWVLFQVPGGPLQCVYKWHPLTIGTFGKHDSTIVLSDPFSMPRSFRYIRGSSNGVYSRGELWFLIHGTTWHKGPGPVYYHRFVVLDPRSLAPKRYTYPFKLETAEAAVEYSLGMTIDEKHGHMTIGYSVYDGTAVLREIDMWDVERLMIRSDFDKVNQI